jgi:hypothetical protein
MTSTLSDIEAYHALANLESDKGYLQFLDFVTVDAQPVKRPFRRIAESWQWDRARRIAPALDYLAGITSIIPEKKSFWNGYHKGSDKTHETARQLCWLLGWSKRRVNVVVCAGKEDQAALITKAMRGILMDNPWIAERVWVTELTAGGASGSSVEILSMNAFGSQGAFPDYIIAEEVTHWMHDEGKDFWNSFVLGSMNKRPNCILNVTTNAGLKGTWQWEERNRVSKSPYWDFYEAPVGPPLPSWMDQDKIDDDSQGMTPGERDRLYKNRWVDPGEEHGYLTLEDAMGCRDESLIERTHGEYGKGYQYFAVIDYGGVHDRCALAVMHTVPGTDLAVVDRLDCWQGTHEDRIAIINDGSGRRSVEEWLQVVRKNFAPLSALVVDPAQMEGLAIKYERAGLRVLRFTYRTGKNNHRMAQLLKTSIQNKRISWSPFAGRLPESYMENGRLRPIEDQTLEQEIAGLITKPTIFGYRFDHESGRHDDRSVVLGMSLFHMFPEGIPGGPLGPKVIPDTRRTSPIGRSSLEERKAQDAAVGRWGILGAGQSGSAWDRGDIGE